MISKAKMFAAGAGDRSACIRASSDARVRASVKRMGRRSLIARLARMDGSLSYVRRISVSGGRSRGMRRGVLLSSGCQSELD